MKFSFFYLAIALSFQIAILNAQPRGIHISWNGTGKTATTMAVTWLNDNTDNGVVKYGTKAENLDQTVTAIEAFSSGVKTYVSKATIQSLKPATYYFYKVGSDRNGWSAVYKFKTAPADGDKSKIFIGLWSDTQNNGGNLNFEQTDTIVKQLSKNTYDFTIHTGDIVENGSVAKSWNGYFNTGQPVNSNMPLMSVPGNHDVVNDTTSKIFQRPFPVFFELMNLPGDQLNYSYNYGNAHFIAINSGYAQGAEKVGKVLFAENSEEYKWLEADLKNARQDKNVKWIIMYSHYPLFVFGVSHIQTWQNHIQPLVDKYKVDLYIAGHRHVYERHKAIKGTQIFEQADVHVYNKPQGTVYVNNGSSGGSLQGAGGWDMPDMLFTPRQKIYTYSEMTIQGNTIAYKVFDKQGNPVDYFKLIKD
ncbi:metallophosphoesterase family protein [Mucilaginibacter sp.]|uniref:purple acid phosphatase family protein n=1 Tax=Mucilaginibacter sp. TaxID=1882438 RepID=UPI0026193C71|nr:metallophosphoesterase family protein [Mucilaginibacter sp.]MDB4924974.1 metallophosphoesterase [Mucilaginibacter sp.]